MADENIKNKAQSESTATAVWSGTLVDGKGSITKTGNGHVRRVLVEAAWAYRFRAKIGPDLLKRQEEHSEEVRALSWKAQQRLCQRFASLSHRGLHRNKVCVAVARELVGFIWAMARLAQSEPAR